jgi:hypothetical protein
MPKYQLGKQWFFPELGETHNPGDVIELAEESAERFMHNEPGLLKPVLHNTQAKPKVVREKKPRRTRARS